MISRSYELTKFGKLCQSGRSRITMTRPELARKLGVTANYISDVERGARKPSQKYICDVTGTLGLSTSEVKKALEHDIANGMPSTENVIPFEAR